MKLRPRLMIIGIPRMAIGIPSLNNLMNDVVTYYDEKE